jgi:hypothetical protein
MSELLFLAILALALMALTALVGGRQRIFWLTACGGGLPHSRAAGFLLVLGVAALLLLRQAP